MPKSYVDDGDVYQAETEKTVSNIMQEMKKYMVLNYLARKVVNHDLGKRVYLKMAGMIMGCGIPDNRKAAKSASNVSIS